ncbi:MAG TPA: 3-phosphoshikimate 1-carboxyvinyltransferase [Tissierellia bacterium]|nr:3-phosphoshikimate 1-carboxyvinyltransferase [Tissierellia bacterium]
MNNILIKPSKLKGEINPPPSKSLTHRAIICASLCKDGISLVDNVILSDDILATIEGMKKLGAEIEINNNTNNTYKLHIRGIRGNIEHTEIDCRESGSTLRFLIPVALMVTNSCTFTGRGRLIERPLDTYYEIFREKNIIYENNNGKLPLTVSGKLRGGNYTLSGKLSSQFVSGLLFALPLIREDSIITIRDKMESAPYVDLTLDILKKFNINIENISYKQFLVPGDSLYKASSYTVEGDYSQAAFYIVAKALGNNVECVGLNENSLQGDKEIVNIIKEYYKDEITIDVSQIPDLVPIIAVLGSLQKGKTTRIINARRLRIKESDRLKVISTEINKLGGEIEELEDGLLIRGKENLKGGVTVSSWKDHRIAMALAIAATRCKDEIILQDYLAVNKSYPDFWKDYTSLGGRVWAPYGEIN